MLASVEEADKGVRVGAVEMRGAGLAPAEEILVFPLGEEMIGREYVRRLGLRVEVSLGGVGRSECCKGLGVPVFRVCDAVRRGAGVSGGGGDVELGVSMGEERVGFGVSLGRIGSGDSPTASAWVEGGLGPLGVFLVVSPQSFWLC